MTSSNDVIPALVLSCVSGLCKKVDIYSISGKNREEEE